MFMLRRERYMRFGLALIVLIGTTILVIVQLHPTIAQAQTASSVSVVVALFFAVSNIRHIIGGIQTLVNAADQIALGNFSDRVTLDHQDELQYLGDSFYLMMEQLAERQHHLQGRIAELEALQTISILSLPVF